jgi:voltage-gated potassium channel
VDFPDKFTNAFAGLWWAVATLTTVGYGDIYPVTAFGRFLGAVTALLGVGLVAIPTGILSAGFVEHFSRSSKPPAPPRRCPHCGKELPRD